MSAVIKTIPLTIYLLYSFYKRVYGRIEETYIMDRLSIMVEEMLEPIEKELENKTKEMEDDYDIFEYRWI